MTASAEMIATAFGRALCMAGCALMSLSAAADSAVGMDTVMRPAPVPHLLPLTNAAQWSSLSSEEMRRGYSLRLEGVVTLVDTNRNLLVLQDGTGALAVNLDLTGMALQPGQRLLLEGDNAAPFVPTYPDYPNRPSTVEWRKLFEARSGLGFDYAVRMRGYLHPPVTGEYTFWIASDNSSDLWLSQSSDPAAARRIAGIGPGLYVRERDWSRLPSQQSKPIRLEAGKAYYIEALHEQGSGPDNLAVAWEGPGISQSVIDGSCLSPWVQAMDHRFSAGLSGRTNGIFWEYFTNYPARSVEPLTPQRASASILTLGNPKLTPLGPGKLPVAQPINSAELPPGTPGFCWVEVEGTVDFVAEADNRLRLELVENQQRLTVLVQNWPPDAPPHWENLRVRVRGVFEEAIAAKGGRGAGMVHCPSPLYVSVIGQGAGYWSSRAATPICNLEPTDPSLAWGRSIMVRGTVVRQHQGELLIQGAPGFYGYVSSNGVDWVRAAPPVEISMSNSVLIGLSVASATTNTLATAKFDHVVGLAASAHMARINSSTPVGSTRFDGSTATVTGGGPGIRRKWDQLEYLYDSLAGDGEMAARMNSLEGDAPQAMAGIMFRNSLDQHAPFASLGVDLRGKVMWHFRQGLNLNSIVVDFPGYQMPCWLKLGLRHPLLLAQVEDAFPVNPGEPVELVGFLAWEGGHPVLRNARCRAAGAEPVAHADFPVPVVPPPGEGGSEVTRIGEIISQTGSWREQGDALQIRGVVTFAGQISEKDCTVVQDETAGIFIELPKGSLMLPTLRVGQAVEFTGHRNGKAFEPVSMFILGMGQLPKPVVHPEEYEKLQRGDGDWIQADGIVQSVADDGAVRLLTKGGVVTFRVGQSAVGALSGYVNALVRIRGVASWIQENELQLLVPSSAFIEVREPPPPDPFIIPSISVASVNRFNNSFQEIHRLKVAGVVTYRRAGLVFLQDASGGIAVRGPDSAAVSEGDQVEAVGFPQSGAYSPILTEALLRKQQAVAVPLPIPCSMGEIVQGKRDGTYVQLKAMVLGQQRLSSGDTILNLEAANRAFRASLAKDRGHLATLPAGSLVRIAGVCFAERVESPGAKLSLENEPMIAAFNLLLRNSADVVLLQRPPWWNWKHTAGVVLGLLLVLLGTLVWVHMLRRRVVERTRDLEIAMAELEKKTQVAATLAERQRLAGEIHDGLEQGLSGIMMQLNGVASLLESKPAEAHGFLELARNMVRFTHAELRHSLLNLQSPLLANADLATALAEIARQMNDGINGTEIITNTSGIVRTLPPTVNNHLFRIGQEAINNALKHAQAKTIRTNLCYSDESVRLAVCDDGVGFDQSAVLAGTLGQHLGLRSLRDRARKMGGQLTVISEIGRGTTIEVVIPTIKLGGNPA